MKSTKKTTLIFTISKGAPEAQHKVCIPGEIPEELECSVALDKSVRQMHEW